MLRNTVIPVLILLCYTTTTVFAQSAVDEPQPNHTLHLELVTPQTLVPQQSNDITVKLTHSNSGEPVTPEQLKTVHTEKIHLLIIDPTLTDYHHIHPQPAANPGEYRFSFTPNTAYNYRIWADIVPVDSQQAYVIADMAGPEICPSPCLQPLEQLTDNDDSFHSYLNLEHNPLMLDQPSFGLITIKRDGQPFTQLEPIMGAYAHIVGFYDDFKTIAHIHPMGPSPTSDEDRYGPEIKFHIIPEKTGHLRLFNQIQANGTEYFAMFGVEVNGSDTDS